MKKLIPFLILFLPILASAQPLGKVLFLEGKAKIIRFETGETKTLSKDSILKKGSIIETGPNSRVLIELSGGVKKMVPPDSRFMLLDTAMLKKYQKTAEAIKQAFVLVGLKAGASSADTPLKKMKLRFNNEEYWKAVQILEKNNLSLETPENLYMAALSYLQIGYEQRSIAYFKQLLETGSFEYRKPARLGLFFNYVRLGQKEKALKMLESFKRSRRSYWKNWMKGE
jgi:hypothetical protein